MIRCSACSHETIWYPIERWSRLCLGVMFATLICPSKLLSTWYVTFARMRAVIPANWRSFLSHRLVHLLTTQEAEAHHKKAEAIPQSNLDEIQPFRKSLTITLTFVTCVKSVRPSGISNSAIMKLTNISRNKNLKYTKNSTKWADYCQKSIRHSVIKRLSRIRLQNRVGRMRP